MKKTLYLKNKEKEEIRINVCIYLRKKNIFDSIKNIHCLIINIFFHFFATPFFITPISKYIKKKLKHILTS